MSFPLCFVTYKLNTAPVFQDREGKNHSVADGKAAQRNKGLPLTSWAA